VSVIPTNSYIETKQEESNERKQSSTLVGVNSEKDEEEKIDEFEMGDFSEGEDNFGHKEEERHSIYKKRPIEISSPTTKTEPFE